MNKENQELKCNFCDTVIKYRQSIHKHSLPCKKGGGEVKGKDVLLKRQRRRCRGEEKEKENVYSTRGKEFSKKANLIRHKNIHQTQNYEPIYARNLLNSKTTSKSILAVLLLPRGIQFKRRSQNYLISQKRQLWTSKRPTTHACVMVSKSHLSVCQNYPWHWLKRWLFNRLILFGHLKEILWGELGGNSLPI